MQRDNCNSLDKREDGRRREGEGGEAEGAAASSPGPLRGTL